MVSTKAWGSSRRDRGTSRYTRAAPSRMASRPYRWANSSNACASVRGGGDRRAQVGEQALDRPTQRFLDLAPRLFQREGRQGVLQPAQVACELQAEDVGAGGQDLAQLDRHRPQMLKRLAQPLARPALTSVAAGQHLHRAGEGSGPDGQQGIGLARDQGVMTRQNPQPAQQAQKGRHRILHRHGGGRRRGRAIDPGQIAHPWWMAAIPPDRLVTDTRLKPASSIRALKAAWSGKRRMLSTRY